MSQKTWSASGSDMLTRASQTATASRKRTFHFGIRLWSKWEPVSGFWPRSPKGTCPNLSILERSKNQ